MFKRRRILATASADRSIKLWNKETHENVGKLIGHEVEDSSIVYE